MDSHHGFKSRNYDKKQYRKRGYNDKDKPEYYGHDDRSETTDFDSSAFAENKKRPRLDLSNKKNQYPSAGIEIGSNTRQDGYHNNQDGHPSGSQDGHQDNSRSAESRRISSESVSGVSNTKDSSKYHQTKGGSKEKIQDGDLRKKQDGCQVGCQDGRQYRPSHKTDSYYFKGMKEVLSNFYPFTLSLFDRYFKCTEAAYQYIKAVYHKSPRHLTEQIANARTGLAAKRLAHQVQTIPAWDALRAEAMRIIVDAKVTQCEEFWEFLKRHPKTVFVENTDNEYWARGKDGSGQNMLGKIHMAVRDEWLLEFNSEISQESRATLNKRYEEFMKKIEEIHGGEGNQRKKEERDGTERKNKKKKKKKKRSKHD